MTGADPRNWMWAEACAMIERAEQMHRQFFQPGSAAAPAASWEPPIDVFESERDLLIVVALPGVDAQDIEISSHAGAFILPGVLRLPAVWGGTDVVRPAVPQWVFEFPGRVHP